MEKLAKLITFKKQNGNACYSCNLCLCRCMFNTQCAMKVDGYEQDTIKILSSERDFSCCNSVVLNTKFIPEGHTGVVVEDHSYLCCSHDISVSLISI